ncbi:hypothetical protein IHE45_06G085600 [Dioscorea alata]|uniref:Uncharacterized protein n=1 Tax=Dioscorea alata TaxID=55571 RepID=A0ACB7VYH9_DIOAL|nr:hypothetical protein IHE45_06G085600 [Dioscorea alata]
MDKKESLVRERDEAEDTEFEYEDVEEDDSAVVVEFNGEVKPIEHPLQPVDDDLPMTFPMTSCSPLYNGVSMGKKLELLIPNEENMGRKIPNVRASNHGRPIKIRYPSAPPSSRNASVQLFSAISMF